MNTATSTATDSVASASFQDEKPANEIDFGGLDDKSNPLNWSLKYKWTIVTILSLVNTVANMAAVICLPAVPQVLQDSNLKSDVYSVLLGSIWELGEAAGPLLTGPLSEILGRRLVYNTTNAIFVISSIACALSTNPHMIVGFRFLSGMGDASIALNASIAGDMFPHDKRGFPIAALSFPPLLGPTLGPAIGGYLAHYAGWRWTFWFTAITSGLCGLLFLLVYRETYAPFILRNKAREMRVASKDPSVHSKHDFCAGKSWTQILKQGLSRPFRMFFTPIVVLFSIQVSIAYGYLFVFFTTLSLVFEERYGFSQGPAGLSFMGLCTGMVIGVSICASLLDRLVNRHQQKTGEFKPEIRLRPMVFGTTILPLGLFLYGWSVQYRLFYIIPMIGTATVGLGYFITNIPLQAYFVDIYGRHAASAISATVVVRCLMATILPLAAPPLFNKIGLGWGNSVFGFIALTFIPIPLLMMRHGEKLRTRRSLL